MVGCAATVYEAPKNNCINTAPANDANKAIGIATAPILKKSQKFTSIFCLRKAMSHRIVASEPVIERLGPRSTPIRTALATRPLACAAWSVAPASKPKGRLLTRLFAAPTQKPVMSVPDHDPRFCAQASHRNVYCLATIFSTASTITKSPATNSRIDQLISRASRTGLLLALMETPAVTARAARHVGKPKSFLNDDATNRTKTIQASPPSTSLPLLFTGSARTSDSTGAPSSSRKNQRITK